MGTFIYKQGSCIDLMNKRQFCCILKFIFIKIYLKILSEGQTDLSYLLSFLFSDLMCSNAFFIKHTELSL